MSHTRINLHARRLDDGWEATAVIEGPKRWRRLGAFWGPPPGSHIGLWRTNWGVRGWNFRVGRRYIGPCLTLLAHGRPADTASPDNRQVRDGAEDG